MHTHLYLDESGNLGFGKSSGQYFVITLLATKENKRLKNYVRRKKKEYRIPKGQELKGLYCDEAMRYDFLKGLAGVDLEIHSIVLDKFKIKPHLRREHFLYNHATGLLLIPLLQALTGRVTLILDRRTTHIKAGFRIQDFLEYKLWEMDRPDIDLEIHLLESLDSYGLQAADVVANTIYRYLHKKSRRAYKLIEGKIKGKRQFF